MYIFYICIIQWFNLFLYITSLINESNRFIYFINLFFLTHKNNRFRYFYIPALNLTFFYTGLKIQFYDTYQIMKNITNTRQIIICTIQNSTHTTQNIPHTIQNSSHTLQNIPNTKQNSTHTIQNIPPHNTK